jgi:flagellar basal body-associated protein FliL
MADEANENAEAQGDEKKKGGPMILIGVVGVLMLLEAVGVYALITMTGPKTSEAAVDIETEVDESERIVELLLVEDRFINISTGRVWQWAATVHLKLKNKNLEKAQGELEKRQAEISEGVAEIIAGASDRHLREPSRETVKRQIGAFVQEVFGNDADGEPRVEKIVISRWLPSPLDF